MLTENTFINKKQSNNTPMEAQEEWRYNSYSITTSALDEGGQSHARAAIYPRGKDPRFPFYSSLGGPQGQSGHKGHYRESNLDRPVVHSVARRYTD
jgi:hypothetical protein